MFRKKGDIHNQVRDAAKAAVRTHKASIVPPRRVEPPKVISKPKDGKP